MGIPIGNRQVLTDSQRCGTGFAGWFLYRTPQTHVGHREIYKVRRDIKAILHAHPPAVTSMSTLHQTVDTSLYPLAHRMNGDTQIIFVSQYLEFASDVYETSHLYFVNKEKLLEYLPKALTAAHEKYALRGEHYLYFQFSYKEYQVPQNDVLYLEHIARQTCIHTATHVYSANEKLHPATQVYSSGEKLQDLLNRMGSQFCSCHKSFAVNLYQVRTLHHTCITLRNGVSVPVSRSRYPHVRDVFARLTMHNGKENFYG